VDKRDGRRGYSKTADPSPVVSARVSVRGSWPVCGGECARQRTPVKARGTWPVWASSRMPYFVMMRLQSFCSGRERRRLKFGWLF
jgi:hypothetical protein